MAPEPRDDRGDQQIRRHNAQTFEWQGSSGQPPTPRLTGRGRASGLLNDGAVSLLGGLRRRSEQVTDLGPWDPGSSCRGDRVDDLAFTAGASQGSTLQQVLLDGALVGSLPASSESRGSTAGTEKPVPRRMTQLVRIGHQSLRNLGWTGNAKGGG